MRILYICSQYPTLTETFIAREMEQLVKLGNQVIICPLRPRAHGQGSGLVVAGVQVVRGSLNPWSLARAQVKLSTREFSIWSDSWRDVYAGVNRWYRLLHLAYILARVTWLANYFRLEALDQIRAHFLHSEALAAMWLARMLKKSYSLTVHTSKIYYPQPLIRKAIQNASFITADSRDAADFAQRLGVGKVHLIRNGVNLAALPLRANSATSLQNPLIVAVGSLVEKKGFDVLLQACGLLQHQGLPLRCRILGEGPERPRLEELVYHLGLKGVVEMPGAVPFEQFKAEMDKATIFVMPSKLSPVDIDGIPTVLIESMALGVPIVATRMAGIPELVKDEETGLLAEPNNPDSLASAIERLLGDRNLQTFVSQNGRRLVESDYDVTKTVAQLSGLMERHNYKHI